MSRTQRTVSSTNIYHVMFRGINRQQLFEERQDYERFLFLLEKYKPISGYKIYAYCLMPNHIHLLIQEGDESLGLAFRRIGSSFVYWYNAKYTRVGHLFQDRYKSETIESDVALMRVIRYIHQNPVKAGLCERLEDYRYSSFVDYGTNPLIDSHLVFEKISREDFYSFQQTDSHDAYLDIDDHPKKIITDDEAKQIMIDRYSCFGTADFQRLREALKEQLLRELLASGGSLRQISRLTGATIGMIRKLR
ncbi:MAG: transposase [Firmicutes bacterium]|nr:transposase [Bacillota bacterium]